eukprot:366228-Chlamydomonas_euryale.AAC.13
MAVARLLRQNEPQNLDFLTSMQLSSSSVDAQIVWRSLLAQRAVRSCCGVCTEVLQSLMHSMCHGEPMEAQCAYEELSCSLSDVSCHPEAISQAVNLSGILDRLFALGYSAPSAMSSHASITRGTSTPQPSGQIPGNSSWQTCISNLRLLLRFLTDVCREQLDGLLLLNFLSEQARGLPLDVAKDLLLGLHRLRLDPLVLSSLLFELNEAREVLVEAWAASHERSWNAAETVVAEKVSQMGPSRRAALHVLSTALGSGINTVRLSQCAAMSLLHSMLGKLGKAAPKASSSRARNLVSELHALFGEACDVPKLIAAARENDRTDFWMVRTMIEAADVIIWPAQVAGELPERESQWWIDELKAFDEKLGRTIQAAGVRKALSTIKNNHGMCLHITRLALITHLHTPLMMLCMKQRSLMPSFESAAPCLLAEFVRC